MGKYVQFMTAFTVASVHLRQLWSHLPLRPYCSWQ